MKGYTIDQVLLRMEKMEWRMEKLQLKMTAEFDLLR